jgi:DNA-directed RNA polymerase specialized sigma24 family protein
VVAVELDLTPTQWTDGPITAWINGLRRGEARAAEGLWVTYSRRMRGLARRLLTGRARRTSDGDDVAASAFRSFYSGARAERFPRLRGRHDLWPLLAALTSNKCVDRMRREGRAKRGGRTTAVGSSGAAVLAAAAGGPDREAEGDDLLDRFFVVLDASGDPALRRIVEWKLAGESVGEIAHRLGCVRRTVERKLRLLQGIWESEMT